MLNKLFFVCTLLFSIVSANCRAQDEFCEAVTVILRDAPNQFRNIRGNITQTSAGSKIYKSGIAVPGTISSRFVYSMGNFYEGALAQSKSINGIKDLYEKYKKRLEDCLKPQGLTMKLNDNFYPGLAEYKKVVYLPPFNKNMDPKKLKGHASLEVDYNKNTGLYTLIFYIYEH